MYLAFGLETLVATPGRDQARGALAHVAGFTTFQNAVRACGNPVVADVITNVCAVIGWTSRRSRVHHTALACGPCAT